MSRLHTETFGNGPDLFLIHGWGLHGGIWQPLIEALQQRYRLTVVDLPGHGHSPLPAGGFDLDRLSQLLLDSAPPQAVWIGWSLGGMAALNAALHGPQQIDKLVLVAAQPQFTQSDTWPQATPDHDLIQFSENLVNHTDQTLKRFLALQVRGTADEKEQLRAIRAMVDARPQPQAEALRLGLEILRSANLRPRLGDIQRPLQFIFGGRDMLVPAAAAEAIRPLAAKARIDILPQAGHIPFLSHTNDFLSPLQEFIK